MYGLSIFTLFRNVIVMLLHLESHFKINARQKDLISEAS